jgi:hypothetical protein
VAAPDTSIASAPPINTNEPSATFYFASNLTDVIFECSLDNAAFSVCTTPVSYSSLVDGDHVFRVRAAQPLGLQDQTPASYDWTVDKTFPDTHLVSHPEVTTLATDAVFIFTATEPQVTYQCKLDENEFGPCSSRYEVDGLSIGRHQFLVQAVDAAQNIDPFPAEFSWVVQAASTCRVLLGSTCHDSLRSSYESIVGGLGAVRVRNIDFEEQFVADRDLAVTIQGGYMSDYTLREEGTTVRGLTVVRGAVTIDQLTIR